MNRSLLIPAAILLLISAPLHAQKAPVGSKTPTTNVRPPRDLYAAQTSAQEITLSWFAPFARSPREEIMVVCSVADRTQRRAVSAPMSTKGGGEVGQLMTYKVQVHGEVPHRCHIESADGRSSVVRFPFNEVTPVLAVPPAPRGPDTLIANVFGPRTVTLSWTPGDDATAYRIDRTGRRTRATVLCYLCAPNGSFTDSTAVGGETHTYTIVAIGPGGVSRRRVAEVDLTMDKRTPGGPAGSGGVTERRPSTIMNVNATSPAAASQVARVTVYEDARTVTQILRLAPNAEIAEHHHPHFNETVFVHSGTLQITLNGDTRRLVAGDVAFIPAGTTIKGRNNDAQEAQVVVVFSNVGTPGPLTVPGAPR